MADITKQGVYQPVMTEVGDLTSDSDDVALYDTWFDDGLNEILAETDWVFERVVRSTVSVTASGYTVTVIPDTIRDLTAVYDEGNQRYISFVHVEDLVRREVNLDQTGTPTYWYWSTYDTTNADREIVFWPMPDTDFTVEFFGYFQVPEPLAASASLPLPKDFIACLRHYIRAQAYLNEGRTEQADRYHVRYLEQRAKLKEQSLLSSEMTRPAVDANLRDARLRQLATPRWPTTI